jgi:tRNA(Arg) A34 adenosine deaminase TadA
MGPRRLRRGAAGEAEAEVMRRSPHAQEHHPRDGSVTKGSRQSAGGPHDIEEPWRTALRMAWEAHRSGNVGVGAVITDAAGAIVATGRNRVVDAEAPAGRLRATYLAHAEMDVLAQLPHGDYPDHTLWTTLEPCLMCASAVVLSHVGSLRYAAADPLWSGIDRLPSLNAQVARRWPIRSGPVPGPVGAFCALLPLVWAMRRKPEGVVARAYAEHDPAMLALGRRCLQDRTLEELSATSVEEALQLLWTDLCHVAEPPEDAWSAPRHRRSSPRLRPVLNLD